MITFLTWIRHVIFIDLWHRAKISRKLILKSHKYVLFCAHLSELEAKSEIGDMSTVK